MVILLNEAAGRGARRRQHEIIRKSGIEVRSASSPQAMEVLARELALGGCDRVIAAGGDGTVHHVLNGLVGTEAALGIIPAGSGNDFSRNLGIPEDTGAALERAATAPVRRIDICKLSPANRYFGCIASFGIDSHANRIANRHRGPFKGTSLYVWSLLAALASFQSPTVRIVHDAGEYRGPMLLLAAANAASYGGGLRIAPMASVFDGLLDLVVVGDMRRAELLWHFPKIFSGSHLKVKQVTCIRSTRLHIDADRPLDIFADGEFAGQTPASIELLPAALPVVV